MLFGVVVAAAVAIQHWNARSRSLPPDQRGWGHPGSPDSAQGRAFKASQIVSIRAGGVKVRVNRHAALLFQGFLDDMRADGYRVRQKDTAAYNHRVKHCVDQAACEGQLSEHSWGTALDVNWSTNPLGVPGSCTFVSDYPEDVGALAARWGLRWGGNFSCGNKDPMHFEVIGRPEDTAGIVERNADPTAR